VIRRLDPFAVHDVYTYALTPLPEVRYLDREPEAGWAAWDSAVHWFDQHNAAFPQPTRALHILDTE
jgi:hypothetical protein